MAIPEPGLEDPRGTEAEPAFIVTPAQAPLTWMVFASPHSGSARPSDMGEAAGLSIRTLRSAEDVGVDRLIASGPAGGAPLIAATISRAYVDLNRDPAELDPALIDGCETTAVSAKVSAGFGVIPRRAGDGVLLYDRRLSMDEARSRLQRVHRPYHQALGDLMGETGRAHGRALLVDWHSMPARATAGGVRGVDVVLGDRHGAACRAQTMRRMRALFEAQGWRVGLNTPYAGGYATQAWGRPSEGFEAIQVELSRALYLDEATLEPSRDYRSFQAALTRVIGRMTAEPWPR